GPDPHRNAATDDDDDGSAGATGAASSILPYRDARQGKEETPAPVAPVAPPTGPERSATAHGTPLLCTSSMTALVVLIAAGGTLGYWWWPPAVRTLRAAWGPLLRSDMVDTTGDGLYTVTPAGYRAARQVPPPESEQ